MAYNRYQILNSKLAYKILTNMNRPEGSYPSKIAQELKTQQTTISDILKGLRELNLVKRTKRTKAQFYVLNYDGLADSLIKSVQNSANEKFKRLFEIVAKRKDIKTKVLERTKDYLKNHSEATFSKMGFDIFLDILIEVLKENESI